MFVVVSDSIGRCPDHDGRASNSQLLDAVTHCICVCIVNMYA